MAIAPTYKEEELVKGCRDNDPRFQKALYQQHYRKMYGICLRYADNKDDAADILQEGFIQVFRYIESFRGGSLEGWIRRIMVNMAIAYYRKKSKYFMTDVEEAKGIGTNEDAMAKLSADEIMLLVQALPVGYRTVFNLYEIEGYNHIEIGEMLGISTGTSKSQLSRAKEMLRNELFKKYKISSSS